VAGGVSDKRVAGVERRGRADARHVTVDLYADLLGEGHGEVGVSAVPSLEQHGIGTYFVDGTTSWTRRIALRA